MKLAQLQVLSDGEVEQVHLAALRILAKTGIYVEDERVLRLLGDAGASVDLGQGRCRLPERLVMAALETTPRRVPLYDRLGRQVATLGEGVPHPFVGHGMPFILELGKGPRPATKADVVNLIRLVDALPNLDVAAVPASPQDVPTRATFAHAAEAVLSNSVKPLFAALDRARVATAIVELARLATGVEDISSHPVMILMVSLESPLRFPREITDMLTTVATAGVPMVIHTAPLSGASAPLTLAGVMVIHDAEVLAGIVIAQLVRRGTPIIFGGGWGAMEMRGCQRVVASPEAALLRIAGAQLTRFYDLPRHTVGIYADCPSPDEQTGWEKMLTGLATMASGFDLMSNSGELGTGMLASYEQVILDNEMLGIIKRMLAGFSVTPDTLALDMIERVGPGGNYLTEAHTLAHLRSGEFWEPTVAFSGSMSSWVESGMADILPRARARVQEILRTHWAPALPNHVLAEMARVVATLEGEPN